MPFRCNGANRDTSYKDSDFVEFQNRNSVQDIEENSSTEEDFRGFNKVPTVLVERVDITSYLKNTAPKLSHSKQISEKENNSKDLNAYFIRCSVNVVRNDLDKLKTEYLKRLQDPNLLDDDSDMSAGTLKCKICGKLYCSEKKLQNHQANKHMIVYKPQNSKPQKRVSFSDKVIIHEVREYHRCRKCTKIFKDYTCLKAHMKQKHKKRKCYICNYCVKKFIDRIFFKIHIKLHCDMCGLLLPNKSKYQDHRRNVCRVFKIHKCKTCDNEFFNIMHLQDHSYEHSTEDYVCDVCKDQFKTKCAIAHHISYLHSKKRPTSLYSMRNLGAERLYLCNFCDESSVEREFIENHVQSLPDLTNKVMTGYKDYYFCDHCYEKFETETDMLQHKWSHFLKTNNSPAKPKSILESILTNICSEEKTTYRIDEELPNHLQPKVVLEKIKIGGKEVTQSIAFVDINNFDINNGEIKKPVVDPISKKTIISNHQCQTCGKYYSSNYCLNRHIETQHCDFVNLRCKVCEETFVWPSLLRSHRCIRLNHPEMPFDDARPEIFFDNIHDITQNGFDDLNIADNDDYMNSVDFDIPAPIVELNEGEAFMPNNFSQVNDRTVNSRNLIYKVVQEVPIEF